MLRWLIFETKVGELLLIILEQRAGLAVVSAEWLAMQCSGEPAALSKAR